MGRIARNWWESSGTGDRERECDGVGTRDASDCKLEQGFRVTLVSLDVLRLETHTDESADEILKTRDPGEDAQGKRRSNGVSIAQSALEDAMGKDLRTLCLMDGPLPVVLNLREVVGCERV